MAQVIIHGKIEKREAGLVYEGFSPRELGGSWKASGEEVLREEDFHFPIHPDLRVGDVVMWAGTPRVFREGLEVFRAAFPRAALKMLF